jgi:phosphatidylserine/phosphatidylglycerophosphate/cardiolipin synthase-like enzyme
MGGASGIATLRARLGRDTELVARLAAPLWARVGRTIRVEDLFWTRGLVGDDAPKIVWNALEEAAGCSSLALRLSAECVARLCSALTLPMSPVTPSNSREDNTPGLVWTLPLVHILHASRGSTYREAVVDLIAQAREQLIFVAPFIDSAGIGGLLPMILSAMLRGVKVVLFTHDALNIASFTSKAIEELRREAERIGGQLAVYSAEAGSGRDRQTHPLLHSKLVISDKRNILIGSANLTSHALASNFEAGVLLGSNEALEALGVVCDLIDSSRVYLAFKTDQTP